MVFACSLGFSFRDIIGIYPDQGTQLIQLYIYLAGLAYVILYMHITELLRLYFSSVLKASVNLNPFLNNVVFAE